MTLCYEKGAIVDGFETAELSPKRYLFAEPIIHGLDSRYIQKQPGHKDIKTTLIYTHVTTNRSLNCSVSPLDQLDLKKNEKK